MRARLFSIILLFTLAACDRSPPPPTAVTQTTRPKSKTVTPVAEGSPSEGSAIPPESFDDSTFDAPSRIVAIGDVHGDMDALRAALASAEITNDSGHWDAGDTTLVQTGDVLDRGDDEQAIIDYLQSLRDEAAQAGGQVVLLNGNHETMNVAGDLRYVTREGFADFQDVEGLDVNAPQLARLPDGARPRMAAFMPGGPYAKKLAQRLTVAIVDDTVFVHGGVLPEHVEYGLDELNDRVASWMRGDAPMPEIIRGNDAPTWTRSYSSATPDCATLTRTLDMLRARRMVVGHTPQNDGITSACDGKIWRIDVGMAEHYGGTPSALTIEGGKPTAVSAAKTK